MKIQKWGQNYLSVKITSAYPTLIAFSKLYPYISTTSASHFFHALTNTKPAVGRKFILSKKVTSWHQFWKQQKRFQQNRLKYKLKLAYCCCGKRKLKSYSVPPRSLGGLAESICSPCWLIFQKLMKKTWILFQKLGSTLINTWKLEFFGKKSDVLRRSHSKIDGN